MAIDETVDVKGKGKATATNEPMEQSMDEEDDDDSGDEEVSQKQYLRIATTRRYSEVNMDLLGW